MKGDRWTPANKRAAAGFDRYVRRFPAYTPAQRQTAESAFITGFRSGVVFVEQQYREMIRRGRPEKDGNQAGTLSTGGGLHTPMPRGSLPNGLGTSDETPVSAITELLVCVDNGCPHDDDCPSGCRAVEACRESIRLDQASQERFVGECGACDKEVKP